MDIDEGKKTGLVVGYFDINDQKKQNRMPRLSVQDFQKSITKELTLIKDRVEYLIGDANWAEVGRFKEAILRKTISQFMPSNLNIGTGFIVGNNDHVFGQNGQISSQLDIIIYEDKSPVIFKEGDFVILTENAVRAVIEVKTKIINYSNPEPTGQDNALNIIIAKFNRLRDFETFRPQANQRKKFVGIFSFEYEGNFSAERVDEALRLSNGIVNHISLGANKFIRFWENTDRLDPTPEYNGRCYIRYNLTDLSFSYFISNLLHIVSDEDPVERYWFSFPIEGTKERFRAEPRPVIALNEWKRRSMIIRWSSGKRILPGRRWIGCLREVRKLRKNSESQLEDIDMEQYSETVDRLFVIFDCLDEIDGFEQLREESSIYLTIKIPHQEMLEAKDPFKLMSEWFFGGGASIGGYWF